MKILITGSSGFIGSHLVEHFVSKGFKVVAFDRYNSNNDLGWLEKSKFKSKINFILGDIRDYDSVYKSMKDCGAVIHLAALIGIPYSYFSPTAYIKTNLEGTFNVLESAKNLKINQVIITSTSEVYGTAKQKSLKETDNLSAQSPYAASKIAADQLALSYFRSFNLPVKIIRPFNTFGPRQSLRAVIPTIVSQIIKNKNGIIKVGNSKVTRDFVYVEDLCFAYEQILKSKKLLGEVVNVGSNFEISISQIAKKASKILKKKCKILTEKKRMRPQKSEVFRLRCNNSKIKKFTKWTQKYSFENGLKKFIEWQKKEQNLKQLKTDKYNI
tara:strand:+ start:1593 stop:2573 length:981 start_codon:yes stop_codon:yes gene_type:complete